jgi:hypothetical protein
MVTPVIKYMDLTSPYEQNLLYPVREMPAPTLTLASNEVFDGYTLAPLNADQIFADGSSLRTVLCRSAREAIGAHAKDCSAR